MILNMITIKENAESSILARVMSVDAPSMPEPVARELLKWRFSDDDTLRMSELANKARAGSLTRAELDETEAYERVGSFLGMVKSKARRSLRDGTLS